MNLTGNFSGTTEEANSYFTAAEIVIGSTAVVFLTLLAFSGNSLTCVVFCRRSHLCNPTNVAIVILATSDVLSAVLVMPFSLASFMRDGWVLGQAACLFNAYLTIALLGVTIISMACTAVIRYFRLVRPSLQHYLRSKRTFLVISTLWLAYLTAISLPVSLQFPEGYFNQKRGFCRLHYKKREVRTFATIVYNILLTFGFFLALIMFTAYYKAFRFVHNHNQIVASNLQQGISRNIEEAKVTKTLVTVVVGFIVCWIPTGIIQAIKVTKPFHKIDMAAFIVFLQTIFIFTSSAINPFIYTFTNRRFQKEYVRFLRSILPNRGQVQPV